MTVSDSPSRYKVGDRITIPTDSVLGNPPEEVTVVSVLEYGYEVRGDDDPVDTAGEVNFDLVPLFPH